ncbi:MAG TPA: hypothetical protein VF748_15980 [Candidatus Acidoferrum sp.]
MAMEKLAQEYCVASLKHHMGEGYDIVGFIAFDRDGDLRIVWDGNLQPEVADEICEALANRSEAPYGPRRKNYLPQ